jgi:hypothetical protein
MSEDRTKVAGRDVAGRWIDVADGEPQCTGRRERAGAHARTNVVAFLLGSQINPGCHGEVAVVIRRVQKGDVEI